MMFRLQFAEAITNLMSAKLRSFLALLGVLVGTASVVAMVSGGNLATQAALKELTRLGTNLLSVSLYAQRSQSANNQSISLQDVYRLPQVVPAVTEVGPYSQVYSSILFEGHQLNGSVVGVSQGLAPIVFLKMLSGRFISDLDNYSMKCVVGYKLYQNIRQFSGENLLNKQIQIGKQFCTVVGIAQKWQPNSFMYTDLNTSLMIPLRAARIISKFAKISNIIFRLKKQQNIDDIKTQVQAYIKAHTQHMRQFYMSPKQLIASAKKQSDILTLFLAFIGSISLIVGGIGVMNIMLVSVVERKREIGIRKAVGAKSRDIIMLFLIESVILSLIGGVFGVLLGVIVTYVIAFYKHWHFTLYLLPIALGFCVSVLSGIFFGLYPAYKASKLDPIEALHSA